MSEPIFPTAELGNVGDSLFENPDIGQLDFSEILNIFFGKRKSIFSADLFDSLAEWPFAAGSGRKRLFGDKTRRLGGRNRENQLEVFPVA